MCVVREMFSDGRKRERETALRDLAQRLGYGRIGPKIRETLAGDLIAAVRRGVVENRGGELALLCRSIDDYEREFLKDQFLASLGRVWIEREEAGRAFARWLGFYRTGPNIQDTARSLINGLIREGRLASEKTAIRRIQTSLP
jgi:hypothetical protein